MKCAAPLGGGNDLSKFSPNIGWSQGSNCSFRCMGQSKTPSASPRLWPLAISLDQLPTGFSSDARSAEDSEAQMPFACNHVRWFSWKTSFPCPHESCSGSESSSYFQVGVPSVRANI